MFSSFYKCSRYTKIIKIKFSDHQSYSKAVARKCSVKKEFSKISQNGQERTCVRSLFFYAGLRPATLLKKRVRHRCFLVNFSKFLKTSFSLNTSGGCFFQF